MSLETIRDKFLILGESGKRNAEISAVAAGGFGIAIAVILGTSKTFKWQLHTRDNLVVSNGSNAEIEIFEAPFHQGANFTIQDVSTEDDYWWDSASGARRTLSIKMG